MKEAHPVSLAAVGLGAKVVERHFTFDRNAEGPDHAASLEPEEFLSMTKGIREIEQALGDGKRVVSQGEMINRENLAKSLVAAMDIERGQLFHLNTSMSLVLVKAYLHKIMNNLGKTLQRDMSVDDYFFQSDINQNKIKPRQYNFKRPWGVPVRYHDFNEYHNMISPDLFEFHLSYSDLDLNIDDFFNNEYQSDFVVHAPELFSGSHLMDLASPDDEYRKISLKETQRVIDITRSIKKFFPSTKKPMIVANVGGFTMDATLPIEELKNYYGRFQKSLDELDLDGVELIPQKYFLGTLEVKVSKYGADECLEWCKN